MAIDRANKVQTLVFFWQDISGLFSTRLNDELNENATGCLLIIVTFQRMKTEETLRRRNNLLRRIAILCTTCDVLNESEMKF